MPTILEETKFIMNKYNIKADKRLGQNFLVEDEAVNNIIESSQITEKDLIIEIGPGLGTLTKELLEKAKKVICIELYHVILDFTIFALYDLLLFFHLLYILLLHQILYILFLVLFYVYNILLFDTYVFVCFWLLLLLVCQILYCFLFLLL